MTDDGIGLVFFAQTRYLVQSETGAVLVPRPGGERVGDVSPAEGWEIVTRDELFSRWPAWEQKYDELERSFADT